nr:hypothetical protein [Tanacetum cinerariifolium]
EGFEQIVNILNANLIKYALTVNPTIYTSCIQQFWESAKVKIVNEDVQIRALVYGKKIIVTEASIRRDLQLQNAKGTACLPNDTIFEELTRMCAKTTTWKEFCSAMASAIICLATNQKFNFSKYILDNMVKNLEARVKFFMFSKICPSVCESSTWIITSLFVTMMVQAPEEVGKGLEVPTDTHHTPVVTQPSSSQPQKKQKSKRKQRKETEESVPTPSNDPLPSVKDRMQLSELMELCTKLSDKIRALVYGKKIIVTEASIRRDLQLQNAKVLKLLPGRNFVALWHLQSSV